MKGKRLSQALACMIIFMGIGIVHFDIPSLSIALPSLEAQRSQPVNSQAHRHEPHNTADPRHASKQSEPIQRSSTANKLPTLHLTIAHTNDIHGHLMEKPHKQEMGIAKLASLINDLRQKNPDTLLIDAGDLFQGTIYSNVSQGEAVPPLVNELGYMLSVAGNHEFDYGLDQLQKLRSSLNFPLISANIVQHDGSLLLEPYLLKNIKGYTFAFVGLTSPDTSILAHPERVKGLTFLDPVQTAKQWVSKLEKQADEIIIVSHCGIEMDRRLARQIPGIHLIIGGHSHTKLNRPEMVNGVSIVQTGEYGRALGSVDLHYEHGSLTRIAAKLLPYPADLQPDPKLTEQMTALQQRTDLALNESIASTSILLDGERARIRAEETNLGNLLTDAMLLRIRALPDHNPHIALLNSGSIRTSVLPGRVLKRELYEAIPFDNLLTVVRLTGREVREVLETGASEVEKQAGRFLQVSGVSCHLDPSQPVGSRISQLRIQGSPVKDESLYQVIVNDYMAAGGDGYSILSKKKQRPTGITLYEAVEQYMRQLKLITYKKEGRITQGP